MFESPLLVAFVVLIALVIIFEILRLLPFSGTMSASSITMTLPGIVSYLSEIDLTAFISPADTALLLTVAGLFMKYTRWRTGDIVRDPKHKLT